MSAHPSASSPASHLPHPESPLPFQPRLYDPGQEQASPPPGLSLDLTLDEFYERYVLPQVRVPTGASPLTIKQDRESLTLWGSIRGRPTLRQIEAQPELASGFAALVRQTRQWRGRPLAANTIIKHCGALQFILDRAGPRTRTVRTAAGLFAESPPFFERPRKQDKPATDNYTLSEIERYLEACASAQESEYFGDCPPAIFHRALCLFLYNTGLRIGAAMQATLEMLDADPSWPGFMILPDAISKRGSGGRFFVNKFARAALDLVAPYRGRSRLLFPLQGGWTQTTQGWLHTLVRRIQQTARIYRRGRSAHGWRKTLIDWVDAQNPRLAAFVGGHKTDVTGGHYVNPQRIRELLQRLPQPGAIQQRELF